MSDKNAEFINDSAGKEAQFKNGSWVFKREVMGEISWGLGSGLALEVRLFQGRLSRAVGGWELGRWGDSVTPSRQAGWEWARSRDF